MVFISIPLPFTAVHWAYWFIACCCRHFLLMDMHLTGITKEKKNHTFSSERCWLNHLESFVLMMIHVLYEQYFLPHKCYFFRLWLNGCVCCLSARMIMLQTKNGQISLTKVNDNSWTVPAQPLTPPPPLKQSLLEIERCSIVIEKWQNPPLKSPFKDTQVYFTSLIVPPSPRWRPERAHI